MDITILGSGGCMVIPKPLCDCAVCTEARAKGVPYSRTGPAAFIHDEHLLIDTPAESGLQLNRAGLRRVDHLLFTHLDPDHVEGFRVVEQVALDFRTWKAYPAKRLRLLLPERLDERIRNIRSVYGPLVDFYEQQGFLGRVVFRERVSIGTLELLALPVDRGDQTAFVYVFEQADRRLIYAPCDIKPFPEDRPEVQDADLLVIQPGIFETRLKHGFNYPPEHVSRRSLYTFDETLALVERIRARQTLFVHLEEYWNRGYDDYRTIEQRLDPGNASFAYDGRRIHI